MPPTVIETQAIKNLPDESLTRRQLLSRAKQENKSKAAEMLLNRVPLDRIATALGVRLETVYVYKRELEKEWQAAQTQEMTLIRARELEALDQMERECLVRSVQADTFLMSPEDLKAPDNERDRKAWLAKLRVIFNDEGQWFDRRLRIVQERLKLLGAYPKVEPDPKPTQAVTNNDNRSIIVIQPPDHAKLDFDSSQIPKGQELGEFMRNILGSGGIGKGVVERAVPVQLPVPSQDGNHH